MAHNCFNLIYFVFFYFVFILRQKFTITTNHNYDIIICIKIFFLFHKFVLIFYLDFLPKKYELVFNNLCNNYDLPKHNFSFFLCGGNGPSFLLLSYLKPVREEQMCFSSFTLYALNIIWIFLSWCAFAFHNGPISPVYETSQGTMGNSLVAYCLSQLQLIGKWPCHQ